MDQADQPLLERHEPDGLITLQAHHPPQRHCFFRTKPIMARPLAKSLVGALTTFVDSTMP